MKFLLIFVLIAYTSALSSTIGSDQDMDRFDSFDPVHSEQDSDTQDVEESSIKKTSESVVEVRRRENCTYIYKPVYPVFCHPMAPRDEEGKCRKIVSLQIECGSVEKNEKKCIPSPDNSEECYESEDVPIGDESNEK